MKYQILYDHWTGKKYVHHVETVNTRIELKKRLDALRADKENADILYICVKK